MSTDLFISYDVPPAGRVYPRETTLEKDLGNRKKNPEPFSNPRGAEATMKTEYCHTASPFRLDSKTNRFPPPQPPTMREALYPLRVEKRPLQPSDIAAKNRRVEEDARMVEMLPEIEYTKQSGKGPVKRAGMAQTQKGKKGQASQARKK